MGIASPGCAIRLSQERYRRSLVADLEDRVRERGGITLWVGTDDEDDMTTLAGVDLYPKFFSILPKLETYVVILMSFTKS
jgi:hypothetical protein